MWSLLKSSIFGRATPSLDAEVQTNQSGATVPSGNILSSKMLASACKEVIADSVPYNHDSDYVGELVGDKLNIGCNYSNQWVNGDEFECLWPGLKPDYLVSNFRVIWLEDIVKDGIRSRGGLIKCMFKLDEEKLMIDEWVLDLSARDAAGIKFKFLPGLFLLGGDIIRKYPNVSFVYAKLLCTSIADSENNSNASWYEMSFNCVDRDDFDTLNPLDGVKSLGLSKSPTFDSFEESYKKQPCTQGTADVDFWVDEALRQKLNASIDYLCENTPIDYHPNSNCVVRDIVHPALFPYIRDISPIRTGISKPEPPTDDFWGRKFENSVYQWLPTWFQIDEYGKTSIQGYINNLPRDFFQIYSNLEELFSISVPLIDVVLNYCKDARPLLMTDEKSQDDFGYRGFPKQQSCGTVRGSEIQVITKIVDYELKPGQGYEGVWHVEGMSHERIVATVLYVASRSESILGGEICFKRAFFGHEARWLGEIVRHGETHQRIHELVEKGFVPLGKIETPHGRLVAFPNCNIHKLQNMVNSSADKQARRRIAAFFIVDPNKPIMSTREVPLQQEITRKRSQALKDRLRLMSERKYQKQDFNVRQIHLCEH